MNTRLAVVSATMLMVLCFTLSPAWATSSFTPGQHAVIIRIDDIQDYDSIPQFTGSEYKVLQYQLDQHVPTLVAIITSRFGTDAHLIELIRTGFNQGIFLLGNHGWHHDLFNNKSAFVQTQELGYAENRLQTIFGSHVLTFIPPYGGYNDDTIAAMKSNQMTMISPTADYDQVMLLVQEGILYLPQTVTTAEVDPGTDSWVPRTLQSITDQISASWAAFGVAVVVIHPRQFVDVNSTWVEARWNVYTQMIDWIKANQGNLILPSPPNPPARPANINPFLISVALFSGITSSLIIAFNISSKRSKGKQLRTSKSRAVEAESRQTESQRQTSSMTGAAPILEPRSSDSAATSKPSVLSRIFNRRQQTCAYCGRHLGANERFCDSCGKPIAQRQLTISQSK